MFKRIMGALAMVAALVPALVHAAPEIRGTLGFAPFGGSASFTGSNLTNATSITFLGSSGTGTFPGEVVNSLPATFGAFTNEFNAANGISIFGSATLTSSASVFQSTTALNIGPGGTITNTVTKFFAFGYDGVGAADRFQFDLLSATKGMTGTTSLTLAGSGVLRDTLGVFADTAAAFTMNTTGSATSISNYSVSFATNPVPEPESFAMLLAGLGVVGFLARRRKQRLTA